MTNRTLSIDDSVYKRMKKHSEIKWSEYVRKIIDNRLQVLERIEGHPDRESLMAMIASEQTLKKEWDNTEDERWNDV